LDRLSVQSVLFLEVEGETPLAAIQKKHPHYTKVVGTVLCEKQPWHSQEKLICS
jgi:hypothetical protein